MKRQIGLLLIVALLSALFGATATAAEGSVILETNDGLFTGFNSIFLDGDTLYLDGYKHFYTWHQGEETPTQYEFAEEEEEETPSYTFPFAIDGSLYAVRLYVEREDDYTELDRAMLCEMTLEDGKVSYEPIDEIDWDDMIGSGSSGDQIFQPRQILGMDGKAYFQYMDWEDMDMAARVSVLDIEEGSVEVIDDLENIYQIAPYKDGMLLAMHYDPDEKEGSILSYDPEEEEDETLCEFEVERYDSVAGLAYDAKKDIIYLTCRTEVHVVDTEADEIGEAVADLPLHDASVYSHACVLEDGSYVLHDSKVAVVDLNADKSDQKKLNIADSIYSLAVDRAIEKYAEIDSSVLFNVDRDSAVTDNLVENLVNQDDSVDIYILDSTQPVYDALVQRGYMTSLDGCETLQALAERMYPAVRESLYADGHIVALPVEIRSTGLAFSEEILEKLGLSLEDVPDNWDEMLDFLPSLKDAMEENDVRLTYSFYTADSVRQSLFNRMFSDYQNYMNQTDADMGYDTELLRRLIGKFEKLDFVALGCAEDEDDLNEDDYEIFFGSKNKGLLMSVSEDFTFGGFSGGAFTPVLMGLDADNPGSLVLKESIAFVNPYSKNREIALAFMDTLAGSLSNSTLYDIIPDLNTPVRGETNEKLLAELNEELEEMKKQLEKAEGSKRKLIEDNIASAEEELEQYEKAFWEVSQTALDWYRTHDETLTVAKVNWLDEEAKELIEEYLGDNITSGEMIEGIDRKAKMMRMEGN